MFSITSHHTTFANYNTTKRYTFSLKNSSSVGIVELVRNPLDIDKTSTRDALLDAFISEYEKYLEPKDIDPTVTSWRDGKNSAQEYYENYFDSEFKLFSEQKVDYWVQAKVDGKLAGWATFEREKSEQNAVYMNLLVVRPEQQKKGIGEHLVKSLIRLGVNTDLGAIHLLLRRKNAGGRKFYSKLGFYSDPIYHRDDNFVDMQLLEPLTWKSRASQSLRHQQSNSA